MIRSQLARVEQGWREAVLEYWRALLICPALFVYIYSNDINIISLNSLIYRKLCLHEFKQNLTVCDSIRNFAQQSNYIQELTSEHMIWLNIAFLIPGIFSIVHLASIADRKLNYELPLLTSLAGSLLQAFVNIFATQQSYFTCFYMLLASQFLNGACGGGSLAFISSCFSHIALYENEKNQQEKHETLNSLKIESTAENIESVKEETRKANNNRSIRYSICETFLLLGLFFGSFTSGYLIGNKREIKKFQQVYIISFALYLIVLIYLLILFRYLRSKKQFIVTNIIKPHQTAAIQTESVNFFKKRFNFIFETWHLLTKPREKNARFYINSLLILYFFGASISMGIMSPLQYLYLTKNPVSLTQIEYGLFKALTTLFRAISLLLVLPISKHFLNTPDYVLFIIGLVSEFLNLIVFSVASEWTQFIWLAPLVYMFSNYFVVCIRAFGSRLVEQNEIGKYFGIIGVVEFLVLLTSSSIFQLIYKATVASFPSAAFLIGCAICIVICVPYLM